jgi:hypothetical protein
MVFRDKMKGCRFRVLATPYEPFPTKWWTDQDAARNVILEVAKILFYKFGGRFRNSNEEGKAETGSRSEVIAAEKQGLLTGCEILKTSGNNG